MYAGQPPWDINAPQPAFVEVAGEIQGSVLDIGCGTGENAIYFGTRGNKVTGLDFLEQPLEVARSKASDRGIDIEFIQHDALKLNDLERQFDNVLDSGLFHGLSDADRIRYADSLKSVLVPGGKLYLQCFSDAEPAGEGPRRVSEQEIHETFDGPWTIKSFKPTRFTVRDDIDIQFSAGGPKSWFCIIERKGD